eukprot:11930278-Alexandrium_andersonii.AAC.1
MDIIHVIQNGGSVYIHCVAGAHRAGTVTSGFAMICFHYTPVQATQAVGRARAVTKVDGDN